MILRSPIYHRPAASRHVHRRLSGPLAVATLWIALGLPSAAQDLLPRDQIQFCSYHGEQIDEDLYTFTANRDARGLLADIMTGADATQNFDIVAGNVPTAAAVIHKSRRWLLFDQLFVQYAVQGRSDRWAALGILAHQAGHHLLDHELPAAGDERRRQELEADRVSGRLLHDLGASLEESQAAIRKATGFQATDSHPPAAARLEAIGKGWSESREASRQWTSTSSSGDGSGAPYFEWPPPRASATARIPTSYLARQGGVARMQDAADQLERALEGAGYVERSYYAVPEGFALATRLEQIEDDGAPKAGDARWSLELEPQRIFSLTSYLRALLTSQPGRYRVVVFVVTPRPFSQSDKQVDFKVSRDWLWSGLNKLPPSIGVLEYGDDTACTALIYEFEQPGADSGSSLKTPSALTGQAHLERTGLWQSLAGRR